MQTVSISNNPMAYRCTKGNLQVCSNAEVYCVDDTCTYRLHQEVQVSTELHTEGRTARGCVNPVETELSDVTDLYHGNESASQCRVRVLT